MSKMIVIPAGSLLTISTGIYSDYGVMGVFRAKTDIDSEALRTEWLALHPDQESQYRFDDSAFLGWVTLNGLLEAVESFEWHLCDYSDASEMSVEQSD